MNADNYTILKESKFFSVLPHSVLESLANLASLKRYKKGDLIIKEDTNPGGCYIIVSGNATVYSLNNQAGVKYVISTVGIHNIIGEFSAINRKHSLFSVEANDDVECLFLDVDTFSQLLKQHPAVSQALLPVVVERIHELVEFFMK